MANGIVVPDYFYVADNPEDAIGVGTLSKIALLEVPISKDLNLGQEFISDLVVPQRKEYILSGGPVRVLHI